MDPLRLTIAAIPLAAYMLLLGLLNLRRQPLMTTGNSDLATLGLALSGVMLVGPLELFRPEAAVAEMGNYVWLLLLSFYWLWVWLFGLLSRPRLVIYNVSAEELHPVLAEVAAELDSNARWAGDSLTLPGLGIQLHLDGFSIMRNVSLASSGGRQSLDGWRCLATLMAKKLSAIRVQSNPRAVSFFLAAAVLIALSFTQLLSRPLELAEALHEVWKY